MPKHYLSYIANAALAVLYLHDHKVNARNKEKYAEVCELNDRLIDAATLHMSRVDYLLTLINKPREELDEFDLIVLANLNFTVRETE